MGSDRNVGIFCECTNVYLFPCWYLNIHLDYAQPIFCLVVSVQRYKQVKEEQEDYIESDKIAEDRMYGNTHFLTLLTQTGQQELVMFV